MNSHNLTKGVIWKQLLFFFIPILIGTFFQQLYNTVDTIIVGQALGSKALAAVGSTGNLVNLIIYFFVGLSSGASVVIAQYYGAQDKNKLFSAVHSAYAMSIICGILMMLFGIFLSYPCLDFIGVPNDIINDAVIYMKLYFLGMIPGTIYNIGSGILRAVGDSKTPLYYLILCSIINVFFDIFLIVYLHMGVAGAAIATVLAQTVCAILVSLKLMYSKEDYALHLSKIYFDLPILKQIIKIGLPAGLQSNMYSIANLVLQTHINAFGTSIIAAWAVYVKIDALYWMVMGAIGQAITTFVGQNYGAGLHDRVKKGMKNAFVIAYISSFLISILLYVFSIEITSIFSSDVLIIDECEKMIHFLTPFYFGYCCVEIFSGVMRGCGESLKPMILVCLGICVLRIIWVTFISPLYSSFSMVIVSYPITWFFTSTLFIIDYYIHVIKEAKYIKKGNE